MSRFKTAAVSPSFRNGIVFKRKGSRVRYIDPATAKVSGWVRLSNSHATNVFRAVTASGTSIVAQNAAVHAEAASLPRAVPNPDYLPQTRGGVDYGRMTVAELRMLAGDLGVKVPSKARKADIISALTN